MAIEFDFGLFLKDYFRPGVNWIIEGPRGSGKTYGAISLLHALANGEYPDVGKIEIITNIVFGTKKNSKIVLGHPPGIHYINTMADALRTAGQLLKKYGMGNVTIAFVLDEAQNFMIADLNAAAENQALIKFMGNTRKFGMCTMFLTPTRRNLAPKIRNFDDDKEPGYCGILMRKDRVMAASIASQSRGRLPARELAFLSMSSAMEDIPILLGATPWTKPLDSLKEGEWSYDTLSAADFSLGENCAGKTFDIKDFLRAVSKGISTAIPDAICDYFDKWDGDAEEEDDGTKEIIDMNTLQAHRAERARILGMKWKDIAFVEGDLEQTIMARHRKVFYAKKIIQKASDAGAYIKPNKEGDEGSFETPEENEKGVGQCLS